MKKLSFKLSIIAFMAFSCRHPDPDYLGKEVYSVSTNYRIDGEFKASKAAVDFTNSTIHFKSSEFPKATATLVIKGKNSGASKTITLNTTSINESNSTWKGDHDGDLYFKDEPCTATLTLFGSDASYTTEFTITKKASLPANTVSFIGPKGWVNPISLNWWINSDLATTFTQPVPPYSEKGLKLIRTPKNTDKWVGVSYTSPTLFPLPDNPNQVWFSIYVFGIEDANTTLVVSTKEVDGLSKFNDLTTDGLNVFIPLSHKGWKKFVYSYNDFQFGVDKNWGGNGNKTREPHRIQVLSIGLDDPDKKPKEVHFDLPLFTIGQRP